MHGITVNIPLLLLHRVLFVEREILSLNTFTICHPAIWFYDLITGINLFGPIYHRTLLLVIGLATRVYFLRFKENNAHQVWLHSMQFAWLLLVNPGLLMSPCAVICTYAACITRSISHRLQKLIHYPYPCKCRSCIRWRCKCS